MLRMLAIIRPRGPDRFGVYSDAGATLGSTRRTSSITRPASSPNRFDAIVASSVRHKF